jgi:putative sterol carrier protein
MALLAGATLAAEGKGDVGNAIETWISRLPSRWSPGAMKDRSGTIVLRLSGEGGGVWHVTLAGGKLAIGAGEAVNPTAVLECPATDMLDLLSGKLQPMPAFLYGRLRFSGDLDFLQQLYSRLIHAAQPEQIVTDTAGWYRFAPLPIDYARKASVGASALLDPPAGKHGFLTVRGEHLVFEDGTAARFWGTNIAAYDVFMDHATARRTAARLAWFGCNMVRLHGLDAEWARPYFFDDSYDDTQHFAPESLDRLDYLVAQLKRRGIYIHLDLLDYRRFRAGDGVRDWQAVTEGAKIISAFDRRIIDLQKQYARDLFTHFNRYTGLRYCDDPCIAMTEITNESSLFWLGGYDTVSPSYIAELNGRFHEWARRRGVDAVAEFSVVEGLRQRNPDVLKFLYHTQVAYFREMRSYLRSIGVKVPVAGSNHWEAVALDLKANLEMDYLDRHGYWDHPQIDVKPEAGYVNRPMVKHSASWNLVTWLGGQRAAGKPLVISEWNCCWINEYIAEGPLTTAAYGAFQGWDGLLQYHYSGADWEEQMVGAFRFGNKPQVLASWPAAARLFLRGDVRPGRAPLIATLQAEQPEPVGQDLPDRAALRRRVALKFVSAAGPAVLPNLPKLDGPALSDTGQLAWDQAGLITVNAPASAARIGFANGAVQVGPVSFDITPLFAVAAVTALDDRAIARSQHLLITATARAENSGMVCGPARTKVLDVGRAPILMEPVRGAVKLALDRPVKTVEVYGLDSVGQRRHPVMAARDADAVVVPLVADCFWYEVIVTR